MAKSQRRSETKPTGAMYIANRKKRLNELGSDPTHTKLGTTNIRKDRVLGGNSKRRNLQTDVANVFDPKAKAYKKAKIINSIENAANRNFARRNILTKGAVIETDAGKAKITSRPGQSGVINAVLV